jgi:glycosyltransferase involved in cell wall biosynthesis
VSTAARGRPVHLLVPDDVDDPARCSGGNVYDRRLRRGLAALGHPVHEVRVPGAWPHPDASARAALAAALAAVPDGAVALVDGLVGCGVPEVVAPAARRVDVVVLVHLPLGDEAGAAGELVTRERATLAAAAGVVATSSWTARRLADLHGLDPDRIVVAAPGVDPAPLAAGTDGASHLLCVGSITPTKGQDVLVEALAGLADLPFTCDLVGPVRRDPAHAALVRDAVACHDLGRRVRMAGPQVGSALGSAYAAADLLVVPSRAETYGMVVTEALARGVPVLASDVGGLPATLGHDPDGNVPGLVVPPGDAAALGTVLRRWWEQPQLRNGLRQSARARREMLDGWEVTSRCVTKALEVPARLAR